MMSHAVARYRTATRYAIVAQLRNRLAFGLLAIFVPLSYLIAGLFTTSGEQAAFKLRVSAPLSTSMLGSSRSLPSV